MASELGSYLRSRRAAVDPRAVGVTVRSGRRVSGLRREEVAVTASVSVDYYTRLEQGRERRPSPQVLDALADALELDQDAREHLFSLAGLAAPRRSVRPLVVAPELLELIEAWPQTPALILSPALDVLGTNALGRALFPGLSRWGNLARLVFSDPAAPRFYAEWDRVAASTVAALRTATGSDPESPGLAEIVVELEGVSEAFRTFWARQDVCPKRREVKHFDHPDVGPLTLTFQAFDVRSAPRQQLIAYRAEPGSASAQRLTLLGALTATPPVPRA